MLWNEVVGFHQKFPHLLKPWMGADAEENRPQGCYCLGGIVTMYLEGISDPRYAPVHIRFPNSAALTQDLLEANSRLGVKRARKSARRIIVRNDARKFSAAAQILKSALEFGRLKLLDRQLAEILRDVGERKISAA